MRPLLLSLVLFATSDTLAQTAPAPPLTLQEALKLLPQSPQWRALERGQDAARAGLEAAKGGSFTLSAGSELNASRFLSEQTVEIDTEVVSDGSILSGHGGGDDGLMDHFLRAVQFGNPSLILSGPLETLESHRMVFAAEESRRSGQVVAL